MRWSRASGARVYYKHGGRHEPADQFRLGVSDGVWTGSALVNLSIALLQDDVPHVSPSTVRVHALGGSQKELAFGAHNLLVLDEDSPDAELTFTLTTAPAFGQLHLVRVRDVNPSSCAHERITTVIQTLHSNQSIIRTVRGQWCLQWPQNILVTCLRGEYRYRNINEALSA